MFLGCLLYDTAALINSQNVADMFFLCFSLKEEEFHSQIQ